MSISVSVDTTKLNEIIAKLPGNRDKIIKATAFHILGEAKKRAPVDTGFLRNSGGVNDDYFAVGGFMNVEFTAEYAAYVELGTHNEDKSIRMPARPYLKPAVEAEAKLLEQRIKEGLIEK